MYITTHVCCVPICVVCSLLIVDFVDTYSSPIAVGELFVVLYCSGVFYSCGILLLFTTTFQFQLDFGEFLSLCVSDSKCVTSVFYLFYESKTTLLGYITSEIWITADIIGLQRILQFQFIFIHPQAFHN